MLLSIFLYIYTYMIYGHWVVLIPVFIQNVQSRSYHVPIPRYITETSHERHGTSNHRQLLYIEQLVRPNYRGNIEDQLHLFPDSKVLGANMGPTWVLSVPDGPHVGPMNLAIRVRCVRNPALTDGSSTQWVIKAENVPMPRCPHDTFWYIFAMSVLCYSLFLCHFVGRFYPHSSRLLHLHCSSNG